MVNGSHRKQIRLIPFWKNERIPFTKITTAGALRAVLVAVMVMALVMALVVWKLIDQGSRQGQLLHQLKQTQDANHTSRLQFEAEIKAQQAYTQAQVKSLACSVVAFAPPAESNSFIRNLAATYHCPPYAPPATAGAASTTGSLSSAGASGSPGTSDHPLLTPDPSGVITMAPITLPPISGRPTPSTAPTPNPTASASLPLVSVSLPSVCLVQLVCLR